MFILCFLLNTLFLLVFVISLGITSAAPILLYFNLEKHHWYFAFRFLTTVYFLHCLFWSYSTLNKYAVPWLFVDRVQKLNSYLFVSTLFLKNMTGYFSLSFRYGLSSDHMNSPHNKDKFQKLVHTLLCPKPKVFHFCILHKILLILKRNIKFIALKYLGSYWLWKMWLL